MFQPAAQLLRGRFTLCAHRCSLLFLPGCLTAGFDPDIYLNRAVSPAHVLGDAQPLVFGKRGATPPLPRNCKRGEQGRARRGGQPLDGNRLGRCAKLDRCVSQETGQGHVLAVFRSRWEDRRERAPAKPRLVDAFPVFECGCTFSLRVFLRSRRGRDVRRLAAFFRGRCTVFTTHEVSGSAVQFRHYPVTVSARAGQRPPWRATTGRQRLGRCPSLKKRESGDRLHATIRGDIE
jgi:hypothetical protein